ncbi:hypothetical protein JW721_04320 [Candidatus Micrarchaeota archaeon]|nr:hypothetical protein [Candidatus Micrarchaeota archaeon]
MCAFKKAVKEKEEIPKVAITEKEVIGELGRYCSANLISEIMKTENPREKLREVMDAREEIGKAAGHWADEALSALGNADVARLFVAHTDAFVEIAIAAQSNTEDAFEAIGEAKEFFHKDSGAFVEIAKACGKQANWAFEAMKEPKVERALREHRSAFVEVAKAMREDGGSMEIGDALTVLSGSKLQELLEKHEDELVGVAREVGEAAPEAFRLFENAWMMEVFRMNPQDFTKTLLTIKRICMKGTRAVLGGIRSNDELREMFARKPETIISALLDVAEQVKSARAFQSMWDLGVSRKFAEYCHGKGKLENLVISMLSENPAASDLGAPLDELHDDTPKRMEYLNSLSDMQVFTLLLSDPKNFYTSTNHLLFDRLKAGIGKKGVGYLLKRYNLLGTKECSNLVLRAVNYDRFYGRKNSLFTEKEAVEVIDSVLWPLKKDFFNGGDFFLMANAVHKIKGLPSAKYKLGLRFRDKLRKLGEAKGYGEEKILSGIEYLLYELYGEEAPLIKEHFAEVRKLGENAYFDPALYTKDGKLQILQVFDKEDTGSDHYPASKRWFAKYGKPKTGEGGELIYETPTARIVLFMGETKEENVKFVSRELKKNPNRIITFRGHSYSLGKNFPSGIFKGKKGHVLFIPGSCGSSGDIASYIEERGGTDLRFISNTATGRGQVTNSLVDLLIGSQGQEKATFGQIIEKGRKEIEKHGGDTEILQVWSPGEALLNYVYR